MISEIDLLKADLPRLEQKFGSNNAFVEVLKAQLASLQKQANDRIRNGQHHQHSSVQNNL